MLEESVSIPTARVAATTVTHGDHVLIDNYAWLQDKADPEVIAYLEAENTYAQAILRHTEPLQEQLYAEMRGRIEEDDSGVPMQRDDYYYYWRIQAGQQYRLFCRKQGSLEAPEEILLDENALSEGHTYCRVGIFEPSPDHTLLAYSVDTTGAWVYDLYIKDTRTGQQLAGPIPQTAWTACWASDNRTLFYTLFDKSHRAFQVIRHTVGETAHDLVYHETDDAFSAHVRRARSGAYIFVTLHSHTTSEVRFLPADQPNAVFRVIHPRQHGMEYYADHQGSRFLIRTNEAAENFKLMEAPISDPASWTQLIAHRDDVLLDDVDVFRDFLVIYERQRGLRQIRLSAPDGLSNVQYVAFPEPVYTFRNDSNLSFETSVLRFVYSSLVTPGTTVDYHVESRGWEVKKRQTIPSGYDPALYESERLYATAADGAQIPLSVVYRKGLQRDGSHPLLMEAYGSYGYSLEPGFDIKRLSLIDRGFVYVIANVRGGSELGRSWYEQGRLMHKKNTFTDFIASAETLIAQGYTSPEHLSILGGSAGGLLMGAVMNMRPDLFKTVAAFVPFTNVITAMLDPDLPLTVTEYEEWGNPGDPAAFEYMLSYSPYENVTAQAYPHVYVKAGLNDLQVPYWDPAKWVARLRAHKTDSNSLVLVTNMGAGHGGASGRYDFLREWAQAYAFLIDTLIPSADSSHKRAVQ